MAVNEDSIIEITDDDGSVIRCELFDIIEFEGKNYALLAEVDSTEEGEEPEIVLMRFTEEGEEEVYFETIDDDEEFERVQAYIESLPVAEEDEEDEE
ncbi:DUF1292 domain-containing protein [bacterium]|nr:DUF1292 domain-containing protein [bacterium]MBQ9246017.1 DUF1292 domain-containing protein [bacterium]MBQ9246880.1 DUF1292 domain-containing protein [bacterium]